MSETVGRVELAAPQIGDRERARVADVLASGQLAAGEEVQRFEAEFAAFCGTAEAVATSNGTTALHAALEAADVGPGDRVLTTPFSFIASANAIRHVGAEPVFVDIDPETYALDVAEVEAVVRSGGDVDAVLAVHLYGLPAPVDELAKLAAEHELTLVEDAAQAHGATIDGRRVGSFGDVGCFSFYPTKNMTTGEGGMIVTNRADVAERAARFIDHGRSGRHEHVEVGHNFRMTDIAAAIGRVQLDRLPDANAARRRNAVRLTDALSSGSVSTPTEPPGRRHVYHQYTVRSTDRDGLRDHLHRRGVETGVYYPTPIHRQRPYDPADAHLPAAERAAAEVLSLPVHPALSGSELDRVAEAVRRWAG